MSASGDTFPHTAAEPAAPAALPWTRVVYWSVRRELWENRAILYAPLAVAALALVAFIFSTVGLPHAMDAVEAGDVKRAERLMNAPSFLAAAVMTTTFVVSIFYCLGALSGERRDRSLLFWKSLPVSDLTTVFSKAVVPLVVIPALALGIIVAAQAVMLAWSTIVVALSGHSVAVLWRHAGLGLMWVVLACGIPFSALWHAPLYAWLLFVSGRVRRMAFVWAAAPFVGLGVFERVAFGSAKIAELAGYVVFGGFGEIFSIEGKGERPVERIGQLDPLRALSLPYVWIGLGLAAVLIWAAARQRRSAVPF